MTATPRAAASPLPALLRTFSWQELRQHGLRHATAVLAVLLGVALAFSVHLINQSALGEFSAAVRTVNGQADLSLRAGHGVLDEALYARVAAHPGVALASPVVEAVAQAQGSSEGQPRALRLLGLDPLVAGALAPELVPRLEAGEDRLTLFAPDAVSLNASARRTLGVQPGGQLTVRTGRSRATLRVVGTLVAGGPPLGVMDIAGAQELLGRLGQLSRIDVQLAPGSQPQEVLSSLALPPSVQADTPDDAGRRVSNVSRAYRVNLTVLSLVALFTGAFLVFSILSLSVARRQPQFALLGVLGLSPAERMRLVLAESAIVGVVGAVLGIALGTGLAAAALRLLGGDLGGGYFAGLAPRLHWSWGAALVYGALGIVAAMAGGWLPARQVQHMAPAMALKGLGAGPHKAAPWRWGVGPGLLVLGVALALLPPVGGVPLWAYLSVACLLLGGIACVPLAVRALLGVWTAPRHPTALLAVERARRVPDTATTAMAGVVASLSLSVALTVMVASFRGSVTQWLDTVLPADLYVRLAQGEQAADALLLDPALLADVSRLPGVRRAVGQRVTPISLQADQPPPALIARPVPDPARSLPLVGSLQPAHAGLPSVYVSEAMVDLYDARPGTVLALPLQPGQPPIPTWVRAVWRDYARQQGAILMEQADYQRLTGDQALNDLALWLDPGVPTGQVQAAVRVAARQQGLAGDLIEFAEPRQIRETTLRIFDRSFAVTYWLQAVAIGIGLFGTAASFSAQVLARRKEFGLLGHLGFTRGQVLLIVGGEGAALTGVGALLGLALGVAVSVVLVHVVNPQSFHWTMELLLPAGRLALLCGAVVLAGTATALISGRKAAGRDAVMAVKEDW